MLSLGIVGQGFVGGSLASVMVERGFSVHVFDKADISASGTRSHPSLAKLVEVLEGDKSSRFSGIYFVCLPTPMYEDGEADVSIVESVLKQLSEFDGKRIAVVKSTVPPGSVKFWNDMFADAGLRIIFNPEFLTEANALDDMKNQNRIVLGGPRPHINTVKRLYQTAFPDVPIIKTSSTIAEMVKYVTNCFLSVKVSFANEIAQICERMDLEGFDIDYDKVVEYAKFDDRLGSSHWDVPGPVRTHTGETAYGFGGHCFPKDINAMMSVSRRFGVDPKVMNAAWEKNLEVRPKSQRDWEHQIGRAVSKRSAE